ncbi:hypothetical protein SAMN05216229_12352 [Geopseudomonas sagittaria]|uniref:Uncharacterized protein n=1 Tax=Geopseudomonas sagittaria TaxID=1135990 RepID=A0A1I5YQW6_9GAMM|nr:hypothetical protein [Pseudomonas sagittaria]SFQ46633.1 hypothetical protein SAMN05216229_12352 [Pseudomonas sagittaria]
MYPNLPTPAAKEAARQQLACLMAEYTGEVQVFGYCIQRQTMSPQHGVWQKANQTRKARAAKCARN